MESKAPSNGTMFLLLGFSDLSLTAQVSLFMFFLLSYLLSLAGNGLIVLLINLIPRLHSPMYFFLKALSFIELLPISSTVPRALQSFLSVEKSISFGNVPFSSSPFVMAAGCECVLLTVMAFDRYLAICHPLRYVSVMTLRVCYKLPLISWIFALGNAVIDCSVLFTLTYCSSNLIAHFFCDVPPMITLACVNTFYVDIYFLIVGVTAIMFPTILIICSYTRILTSIFLLHSAESRHEAFSTCGFPLVSVIIFFGTAMFVQLQLGNPFTSYEDRMTALFYCIIIPTINPMIYSLKNKEMKKAIRKLNLKLEAVND